MAFAEIIYETPDEWGEPVYASEKRMLEVVASLQDALDGPVSLSECSKHELLRTIDDNQALYSSGADTRDGKHIFPVAVFSRSGGGEYEFVESYDSEAKFWEDCCDQPEQGKTQEEHISDLLEIVDAAFEWIDAIPQDADLPAMPGFDRDWAEEVKREAKDYLEQNASTGPSPGQ